MKTYQLTYIISPEITSQEAESLAREMETFVQTAEGVILSAENPLAKALAYPIKKHASGFVATMEFQMEEEKVKEVEEKLRKDGKIARHMLTVKKINKPRKPARNASRSDAGVEREAIPAFETQAKENETAEEKPEAKEKDKVELKDIDQQLDEILG